MILAIYDGSILQQSPIAGLKGVVDRNLKGSALQEAQRELISGTGFAFRAPDDESIYGDMFSTETHKRFMESLYKYTFKPDSTP
ncbi:MAG: hypothetical protein IT559_07655 [Alphaproteobacteria bacterium]|nr:hypothetical protein [Alphaproteobacteria bacterium]